MGFFSKFSSKIASKIDSKILEIKSVFRKTSEKISTAVTGRKIDESLAQEIEDALILVDAGVEISSELAQKISKTKFPKDATDIDVRKFLAAEIENMLKPYEADFFENFDKKSASESGQKPFVVLIIGVNGNGKTTTIAKIAHALKADGKRPLMVAADTFRAAAVDQLRYWADKVGADFVSGKENADPAGLVYGALESAEKNGNDVVLIDTAGRMQNRADLLDELEKIKRVIKKIDPTAPHCTILVLDGITGQATHGQVETFQNKIGIDGVIITKLDGSAKAGSLMSLTRKYDIRIFAIGVGEGMDDLKPFNSEEFAKGIMGIAE